MTIPKNGAPGDLPPVPVKVPDDAWDNTIRAYGIANACEWFGHDRGSEFTAETIKTLEERNAAVVIVAEALPPGTLRTILCAVPPTYHDLFITTANMSRTSIFNLPFEYRVDCCRTGGWELWRFGNWGASERVAGEYDANGLRLDVGGVVIVDSLTPKTNPG